METIKKFSVKNFIIKTCLKDIKREVPFYYMSDSEYYSEVEPRIKEILKNSLVLIYLDKQRITPFEGNFTLESEEKITGYCLADHKTNSLVNLFCVIGPKDRPVLDALAYRTWIHLGKPKELTMMFPVRKMVAIFRRLSYKNNIKIKFPIVTNKEVNNGRKNRSPENS